MPEPLKNLFNPTLVAALADHLANHAPGFDRAGFIDHIRADFDTLELRQRSARITDALTRFLPADFPESARALHGALEIGGWAIMPMADYVAQRGENHLDLALDLLGEMTKRLTAEFAIRPLLLAHPSETLERLHVWARDPDPHLRRLASEGSRPRLPWGIRLRPFVKDPTPVIGLLTLLRDDPSDYVRRSVANNLNDIAKDHPDRIASLAADWLRDAGPDRRRLIRHACRTLIKQGHPATLAALGYAAPAVQLTLAITTPQVRFGETLQFEITLASETPDPQKILLDYAIHHVKANGKTTAKVFKWKILTLPPRAPLTLTRRHAIRPITTRAYHDGLHAVEILVNGLSIARADFTLTGTR